MLISFWFLELMGLRLWAEPGSRYVCWDFALWCPPIFIGEGCTYLPDLAEKALSEGQCDFVFMGHGLLAEPHLVEYLEQDRYDEIRPCIGCNLCSDNQLSHGLRIRCSFNAVLGNGDNDYSIIPTSECKNVLVIGGGIEGMEAARIAAKRGHKVTPIEKNDHLGGQLDFAVVPPHKDNLMQMYSYFEKQLKISGVKTFLNTEADEDFILSARPDAVI